MKENLTDEGRRKGNRITSKQRSKPVICIQNGKIIGAFDSATEANRLTGIGQANISACCRKVRQTTGGCHWFFQTDSESYAKLLNCKQLNPDSEIQKILNYYHLTFEQIRSSSRKGRFTLCRTLIYKYLREEAEWKYSDIGKYLSRKNSTTSAMVKKFNELLSVNDKTAVQAWKIVEELCKTKTTQD